MNYFDNSDYSVAVVGAGSGIGKATALHLAQHRVRVACLDRDDDTAKTTAAEIAKGGGISVAQYVDVTEDATIPSAIEAIVRAFGRIDALVNCAGITGHTSLAHEVDPADFDRVYRINLRGAFLLSKSVLPHMLARKYGRLLHVGSIAGKEGTPGTAAYSATKAGLIGLVKSMAKDYAEHGITINALAPAVIRTPLVEALPQATVDQMIAKIPMRRCGELEEVAQMIAWIVSPACSFTTGFTFDLSGGRATY